MNYNYVAINEKGKKVKGSVNAASSATAANMVRDKGLEPISVVEAEGKAHAASVWEIEILEPEVHKIKIKKKKLLVICQKMAIMMKAGVTLADAFEVLVNSEKDRQIKKVLKEVANDLNLGINLSDSMEKFVAFPPIMTSIIASGEANGRLDWSFEKITVMFEKEMGLKSKVNSAMGYPIFLIVLVIALIFVMNLVIVPRFQEIYDGFDLELPMVTKIVLAISDFIKNAWYLLILIIGGGVGGFLFAKKKSDAFNLGFSRFFLKIPVFGAFSRENATANFARVVATLVESGVDLIESLSISVNVVNNAYIRQSISGIVDSVKMGKTLAEALESVQFFDPLFISMLRIGERSSTIGETMTKLAEMYEATTEQTTKKIVSLMEPMMTVVIGVIVAFVIASIIVPMFNMYSGIA